MHTLLELGRSICRKGVCCGHVLCVCGVTMGVTLLATAALFSLALLLTEAHEAQHIPVEEEHDVSFTLPSHASCGDYRLVDSEGVLVLSVVNILTNGSHDDITIQSTVEPTSQNPTQLFSDVTDRILSETTARDELEISTKASNVTATIDNVTSSDNKMQPTLSDEQKSTKAVLENSVVPITSESVTTVTPPSVVTGPSDLSRKSSNNETYEHDDAITDKKLTNITATSGDAQAQFVFANVTITVTAEYKKKIRVLLNNDSLQVDFLNASRSDNGLLTVKYDTPVHDDNCVTGFFIEVTGERAGEHNYEWGVWSPWTPCEEQCGHGIRTRSRNCLHEGECGEEETTQTDSCHHADHCPDWHPWLMWNPCTVTCGKGQRFRQRQCVNGSTLLDSAHCPGVGNETVICSHPACSDGWQDWVPWSPCNVTCGGGLKTRYRNCSLVSEHCVGNTSETTPCNENMCPEDNEETSQQGQKQGPIDLSVVIGTAFSVFVLVLLLVIIILLKRLKRKKTTMYAISQEPGKVRSLSDSVARSNENLYATDVAASFFEEPTSPTHVVLPVVAEEEEDDFHTKPFTDSRTHTTSFKIKAKKNNDVNVCSLATAVEDAECSETESSGMPEHIQVDMATGSQTVAREEPGDEIVQVQDDDQLDAGDALLANTDDQLEKSVEDPVELSL